MKEDLAACNQFFYDGRDCIEDVSDVLFEKVSELKDKDSFDTTRIIFDCPESPWLAESFLLLDSDLKILKDDYSFSNTGCENISKIKEVSHEAQNILFVVDLIHTGTVFTKCYNNLRDKLKLKFELK